MRHHTVRMLGVAAAALVLSVGSAAAQGKGHGNDKDRGEKHEDQDQGKGKGEKHDRDGNRGAVVVDSRTGQVVGTTRRDDDRDRDRDGRVPPGLAKKPGHMPPGQYKKRYGARQGAYALRDVFGRNGYTVTRIVPNGSSQYVYYRLPDGTVQRAIVSPGSTQLQFNNVPANILQALLAQLY